MLCERERERQRVIASDRENKRERLCRRSKGWNCEWLCVCGSELPTQQDFSGSFILLDGIEVVCCVCVKSGKEHRARERKRTA